MSDLRRAGVSLTRAAHGDLVLGGSDARPRARARRVDYLELYHRRGQITDDQLWAARTLQSDWQAQDRARSAGAPPLQLDRVDHVTRYEPVVPERSASLSAALRAVGRQLAMVLLWVAIDGGSATGWARSMSRPDEDGIGVLRVALDALAEHYAGVDA